MRYLLLAAALLTPRLIAALEREEASQSIVLEKHFGATRIADADERDLPGWTWPAR